MEGQKLPLELPVPRERRGHRVGQGRQGRRVGEVAQQERQEHRGEGVAREQEGLLHPPVLRPHPLGWSKTRGQQQAGRWGL